MLRATLLTVFSLLCVFFLGAPCLVYAVLSGNTDPLYEVGRISSKAVLWLAGVRTEVHGREKIPAGRAVVFMPNHQSNWDPPGIFVLLPPVLVMGKKEFFRVPVLGRAMRLRGFIPVDRTNRERAIAAVEAASQALRAGHSFLAFPEGTRSRDGRLQTFKKGVFVMAIKAGAPIVPVSISGSYRVMRKGEFAIHPGVVRVTFHDPVPTAGRSVEERRQLIEQVREAIISGLSEEERPLDAVRMS
ncbi:MAG TPA: lysophospholipid acyltransferase family protein [Terriglobia bacterium]|nr:lysophospholipid acyltransferase family protein [Terriglobia bacterium]